MEVIFITILKLDKECLANLIDAYKKINNRDPYIICNKETYDNVKKTTPDGITYSGNCTPLEETLSIGNIEVTIDYNYKKYENAKYLGYKVLIDNDLKYGEVEIR